MTGFAFSTFLVHQTKLPHLPEDWRPESLGSQDLANRVYLVSKDFPLLVQRSAFSRCSVQHDIKIKKLEETPSAEDHKT